MPIDIYKVVQTGAKMELGGLIAGLLIVGYHVLTDSIVKKPPSAPMASGIKRQIRNGKKWNFFFERSMIINLAQMVTIFFYSCLVNKLN